MNKTLFRLNSFDFIRNNIENYINIFSDYYGYDKKEIITKKFKSLRIFTYINENDYKNYIKDLLEIKSNELKNTLFSKLSDVLKDKDIFNNLNFDNYKLFPIEKYNNFMSYYQLSTKEKLDLFIEEGYQKFNNIKKISKKDFIILINNKNNNLNKIENEIIEYYQNQNNIINETQNKFNEIKPLINKISPNMNLNNLNLESNAIKALNKIGEIYNLLLEEYEEYKEEIKSYIKYYESRINTKKNLEDKYYKDYIKENIEYLDNTEELQDYLNDLKDYNNKKLEIIGTSLYNSSLIENFSYKSEELMMDPYYKEYIEKDIIKYFNILGYKINNYNEINNNYKKLIPTKEKINKLIESKAKYQNKLEKEYITIRHDYKLFKTLESKQNLLDKNTLLDYNLIINEIPSCILPNISIKDDNYILNPALILNFSKLNIEHNIIHELNHIYELNIKEANKYGYILENGISQIQSNLYNIKNDEYELLNELINEYITNEIINLMYKNKKNIFNEYNNENEIYNSKKYIIDKIMNNFHDIFINSRTKQELINKISKKNLDELNNLVLNDNKDIQELDRIINNIKEFTK